MPNTALRYKPPISPEEILALYKQHGIEDGERQTASDNPPAAGPQNPPRTPKAETAVIWKLHPDHTMEPVKVALGITDHAYTEISAVLKGEVKQGDEVIIRSVTAKTQTPGGIRR
jgi:hypothetical protein